MNDHQQSHTAGKPPVSTVEQEISRARMLFLGFGSVLGTDHCIQTALADYRQAIRTNRRLMRQMGVLRVCSCCARENDGGCCFHGMEEHVDRILLLINLLWGLQLPVERDLPDHCLFLGRQGCKLLARYHFCVNYFCSDLKNRLHCSRWKALQAGVGAELSAGWEAEHALLRWLQVQG